MTAYEPGRLALPDGEELTWTDQVTILASGERKIFRRDFYLDGQPMNDDEDGRRLLVQHGR